MRYSCIGSIDRDHVQLDVEHTLKDAAHHGAFFFAAQALSKQRVAVFGERLVAISTAIAPAAGRKESTEVANGSTRQAAAESTRAHQTNASFVTQLGNARADEWAARAIGLVIVVIII